MKNQVFNTDLEVLKTSRYFAPSDFIFKIQSFSSLLSSTAKKVQSNLFESGGYKWRLCLSSGSSKKEDGGDHISLYLSVGDTDKLPSGWEVLVNCNFFLFNQIKNKYLSVQDGKVWRFHWLKTEWGFDKLLSMSSFSDPTNGYLVDDCCAFGVEIYVVKHNNATFEYVDLSKILDSRTFSWKITDYSKSETATTLSSPEFTIGGWKWKLIFHPNGIGNTVGKSVSLFLHFIDESLGNSELGTRYKLRIKDQVSGGTKGKESTNLFSLPSENNWGFGDLLSLKDLKDATKNYLLDNTLVLEVEICWLSKVKEIKISDVPMESA